MIPFCALKPVTLLSNDAAATPFCQSFLELPTSYTTSYAYIQPTVMLTIPEYVTVPVTEVSIITKISVEVVQSTPIVTSYLNACGTLSPVVTKKKRGPAGPVPTPTYLIGSSSPYITSACQCQHIPRPTGSTVVTTSLAPSTVSDPRGFREND